MIRTKGEAGTGNVVEAVKHERRVMGEIRRASAMTDEEVSLAFFLSCFSLWLISSFATCFSRSSTRSPRSLEPLTTCSRRPLD